MTKNNITKKTEKVIIDNLKKLLTGADSDSFEFSDEIKHGENYGDIIISSPPKQLLKHLILYLIHIRVQQIDGDDKSLFNPLFDKNLTADDFYSFFYEFGNFKNYPSLAPSDINFPGHRDEKIYVFWTNLNDLFYLKDIAAIRYGGQDNRKYITDLILSIPNIELSNYGEFFEGFFLDNKRLPRKMVLEWRALPELITRLMEEYDLKSVYTDYGDLIPQLPDHFETAYTYDRAIRSCNTDVEFIHRGHLDFFNLHCLAKRLHKFKGFISLNNHIYNEFHYDHEFLETNREYFEAENLFKEKKFDLAIFHSNFVSYAYQGDEFFGLERRIESAVLSGVKNEGFVFILVNNFNSRSSCFFKRRNAYELSDSLAIQFIIHSIISFSNWSLLILRRSKEKGSIKLINGNSCGNFMKMENSEITFFQPKIDLLLEKYFSEKNEGLISEEDLADKYNYSSNNGILFYPEFEGVLLTHFSREVMFKRLKVSSQIRVLTKIPNHVVDKLDYRQTITINSLENEMTRIDKSCMLINVRRDQINAIWFEYTAEPIFIDIYKNRTRNPWVLFYELDQNIVSPEYIQAYLNTNNDIKDQIKFFIEQDIDLTDDIINHLRIQIPSKDDQEKYVNNIKEEITKKAFEEANEISQKYGFSQQEVKEYLEFKKNEMSWLNHAVRTPMASLKLGILNLQSEIKKFDEKNTSGLGDFTKKLLFSYKEIQNFLEYVSSRSLFEENFKEISLKKIAEMLNGQCNTNKKVTFINKIDEETLDYKVKINSVYLKFLINQTIENATKHGKLEEKEDRQIIITLSDRFGDFHESEYRKLNTSFREYDDEKEKKEVKERIEARIALGSPVSKIDVLLSIKNNGIPMKKDMNKEKFSRKGESAYSGGFGGAEISRIAKKYFYYWNLINDDSKEYCVDFRFIFEAHVN